MEKIIADAVASGGTVVLFCCVGASALVILGVLVMVSAIVEWMTKRTPMQ